MHPDIGTSHGMELYPATCASRSYTGGMYLVWVPVCVKLATS